MAAYFKYEFPIKPHLKKFLAKELGIDFEAGDRWELSRKDIYGKYAHALLACKYDNLTKRKPLDSAETIPFLISSNYHFGQILSNLEEGKIWTAFNLYLEDMLNYKLFTWIESKIIRNSEMEDLTRNLLLEFYKADDLQIQQRMSSVFNKVVPSKTRKNAIYEFMAKYGIDDDMISYDSLDKRHKRYLAKKQEKLIKKGTCFRTVTGQEFRAHLNFNK